jgi:hypothetical protein
MGFALKAIMNGKDLVVTTLLKGTLLPLPTLRVAIPPMNESD